ncbi:MAG: nitrilase-related carbon-nitrogen hydrolase, partial [Actinomycetota bacterium]|nr:nitrilase-related carbon-nitrogen hydrolase [Actinomycetota bacterium]
MVRSLRVGAAQLGPIARNTTKSEVVDRLIVLMREANAENCRLVVFPELALTTFFPRWYLDDDPEELDSYYETEMPGPDTQRLFDEAKALGVGFYLGYAELTPEGERYNTSVLVDESGSLVGKYRKVHLPGHEEYEPERPFQHLERRYFKEGPEGFGVWEAFDGIIGMALCNDRRWPETYRVMALQ